MLWIRRLIFVVVIAALAGAWPLYRNMRMSRIEKQSHDYSLVVAEAWVASAQYRYDPDLYLRCRDSLLLSAGLTREELETFLTQYSGEPEVYLAFIERVNKQVDSLITARGVRAPARVDEEQVEGYNRIPVADSASTMPR